MTTYYIHHAGSGASPTTDPGTGGDWSGAYSRISTALSVAAAGDTIKCSNQHAFSGAWVAWTAVGTTALPILIDSVDHNDTSVSSAGAKETYNNSTSTFTGTHTIKGLTFEAITNSNGLFLNNSNSKCVYINCTFDLNSGFSFQETRIATSVASVTILRDCTFLFSNVSQEVWLLGRTRFINCSFAPTDTVPTVPLIKAANGGQHKFMACDFSTYAQTTLTTDTPSVNSVDFSLIGCKLNAATTSIFPTISSFTRPYEFTHHTFNNQFKHYTTDGSREYDNTASKNGGVGWSIKYSSYAGLAAFINVSTANIDLSTNKTLTLEIAQIGAGPPASLTSDEIQLIAIMPNSTDTSLGSVVDNTTISSSTQRWDDSGGSPIVSNITKQKLEVTLTGSSGLAGPVIVAVWVAKANVVVNIDPSPSFL